MNGLLDGVGMLLPVDTELTEFRETSGQEGLGDVGMFPENGDGSGMVRGISADWKDMPYCQSPGGYFGCGSVEEPPSEGCTDDHVMGVPGAGLFEA